MATITSRIVGPDGEPIQYGVLEQEIAGASLTGVRQVWRDSVASDLGPQRLARILQGAIEGYANDFLSLAEEMEEKDGHYGAVLSTRKLAISGLDIRIDAFSDDKADQEIAEAVRELVAAPATDDAVFDLTDALGKSYSVCEIIWDRSGKIWKPSALEHCDPRFFRFDRETGRKLRLLDEKDRVNGIALPPFKFLVHKPRLRTGQPIRGGLARTAAIAFMCKSWTWKDWMTFADIYGIPMRVGRYGGKPSQTDIRKLEECVANLGSDASAVIHESMKIEFQAAPNTAGAERFFSGLAEYWDKQTSKTVLGQTATTDDGPSYSGGGRATVHNEVRRDLLVADAKALSGTLNRDLVRPFVDLNFGPGRYPKLVVVVPKPEDTKALVDAVERLVPMGLEVEMSVMRDKLGLPDPPKGKDVKLLFAKATAPAVPGAANADQALNAERRPAPARSREDQLVELLAGRADPIVAQWVDRIEQLVNSAVSIEEIRDGLLQLLPDLPAERLAQVMQQALAIAGVAGMSDAADESRA